MSSTTLVTLGVAVPVVLGLAFLTAAPSTRSMDRLRAVVLGCIVLTFAALAVLAVADLPTALVCERGRTEVEATPTIQGGRFEEYRVGPCVFYNPESRPVPGLRGGGD